MEKRRGMLSRRGIGVVGGSSSRSRRKRRGNGMMMVNIIIKDEDHQGLMEEGIDEPGLGYSILAASSTTLLFTILIQS